MILLARHGTHAEVGRVLSGRSDVPLDSSGRSEANALAATASRMELRSIHSSPRLRTRQTADAAVQACGLPMHIAAALDEIDFGAFAGRSFVDLDIDPDWCRWNAERDTARCPDGETMTEAVARARMFLEALPAESCPALCVTHCDLIRGFVADLLGLPLSALLRLGCDPGSLTRIDLDERRLVTLNERPA